MKTNKRIGLTIPNIYNWATFLKPSFLLLLLFIYSTSFSQAVTEVITDFNGYWKSSTTSVNTVKPNNQHNLLAFSYNGNRYSTGVNDALLASHGESFIASDFWSLPVSSISGTITSNTKVGLGALLDGVLNGFSVPAPEWGIEKYLTDGIKGLGLGTCIANLPVGSMNFSIQNIQAAAVGDGIPDILVTQIADPSGSYDRYEFTDANGATVGTYKDIVFTNITPLGNWTADFYEASLNPLILNLGFTQTDRPIRLWAADFSDFGITAANVSQIKNFKINLCGNSDVAFVAYNQKSVNFQQVLPVQYNFFTASKGSNAVQLSWQTASEQNADYFLIEKSIDGSSFYSIGSVKANNAIAVNNYSYSDAASSQNVYYRLKQVDLKGGFSYSKIIQVKSDISETSLHIYPNPATGSIVAEHSLSNGVETIRILNTAGIVVRQVSVQKNSTQTKLDLTALPAGSYLIYYQNNNQQQVSRLSVY